MQALWLEEGKLDLRSLPAPEPGPREARVRVLLAGICGTDLAQRRGYADFCGIPGHEFVGVVETLGSGGDDDADSSHLIGQRVVGEINIACGTCQPCRQGRPRHCERREVLGIRGRNGAFAEALTLPLGNLHLVPDSVSDEAAVFVEPLAAAVRVREQVGGHRGERVLVMGAGRLGQLVARVFALEGAHVAATSRHERTRSLLEAAGVESVCPTEIGSASYDLVVDCTGRPEGFTQSLAAVRSEGTLVIKSTYPEGLRPDATRLVVDEVRVVGSRCGPFPPALGLLAQGEIDVAPLVDIRLPLREAEAAFERAERPGAMKVLLSPSG